MITEKLQQAVNDQINGLMWSANLYLSMSFYFKRLGFDGFACWMKCKSKQRIDQACELANYLAKREKAALIDKVNVVPTNWGTPLEVFEAASQHEKHISKMIDHLVDMASEEKDKATQDFLWNYVRRQVDEFGCAHSIVQKLKASGEGGLLILDAKLCCCKKKRHSRIER